jgi:hypothetical protein
MLAEEAGVAYLMVSLLTRHSPGCSGQVLPSLTQEMPIRKPARRSATVSLCAARKIWASTLKQAMIFPFQLNIHNHQNSKM